MDRAIEAEIMDGDELPEALRKRVHEDLDRVHDLLGNTRVLIEALRRDALPVRRVMDVGCGYGGLLEKVRRQLGVDVVGVDLRPPPAGTVSVPILRADATADPLPEADVALGILLAHHLSADELSALIRNVGRTCRRLVLLDLVRHRLPLMAFRAIIGPFLTPVNAADGVLSIRRAYTSAELRAIVQEVLHGTGATFRHSVAPFYIRQVVDIRY